MRLIGKAVLRILVRCAFSVPLAQLRYLTLAAFARLRAQVLAILKEDKKKDKEKQKEIEELFHRAKVRIEFELHCH